MMRVAVVIMALMIVTLMIVTFMIMVCMIMLVVVMGMAPVHYRKYSRLDRSPAARALGHKVCDPRPVRYRGYMGS